MACDGSPLSPARAGARFSQPAAYAQAHAGIQQLLQAETEAAEVVAAAKMQKVQYLKQAKEEADAEIRAYKQQREAQFQMFSKEVRERAPDSRRDACCASFRQSAAAPRCALRD